MKGAEAETMKEADLTEIVESILEESRRRSEEIIAQARQEASKIIEEAKKRAERIKEAKKREADRIIKDELAKRRSAAEVRIKREIFMMQRRYLDLLFEKVRQKLSLIAEGKLPGWNYEEILKEYAREAAEKIGTDKLYLWGREKDIPVLRKVAKELSEELGVNFRVDESRRTFIIGGLVARDENDTRRFYNTFDGRLADYRERNEPRLIDLLFGGSNE